MSLFSIVGLYQELLLQGSFRGVPFTHITGDDEAGRRTLAFLFPGQDILSFQDLGQWDGDITVAGILVGDDFTAQADNLRTAFQKPGPATLVSPWLGSIKVVLTPGRAPRFSFKHDELRVCTFTVSVRRYIPRQPPAIDTLQGILNAISDLRAQANMLLAEILAPVALTLAAVSQVQNLAAELVGTFSTLISAVQNPLVGISAGVPLGLLGGIDTAALDTTYPATVGTLLAGPSTAIAGTTTPALPSAVAPGGNTVAPAAVDGRVTAALILSAVSQVAVTTPSGAPIVIPPGPALILATQCLMLPDAIDAASSIDFTSQQEAAGWRDQVTTAIDEATLAAAAQAPSYPTAAAALWRALIAARAAWIADMNAAIGRLPSVRQFTPPGQQPVWLMAQYLAGDDPSQVVATWRDIVTRNGIWHPSDPSPGPLEVLGTGIEETSPAAPSGAASWSGDFSSDFGG